MARIPACELGVPSKHRSHLPYLRLLNKLKETLELHHVGISTENEKHSKNLPHFQLKHLNVDAKYISQDLIKYLYDHAGLLTHFNVSQGTGSTEELISAFTTPFVPDPILPIRSLKPNNYKFTSNKLITALNDHFTALTNIEFHGCNSERILTNSTNLTLNFDSLLLKSSPS